ncbi:MAG: putative toxin-antitoxin system toxin component, PIN family [Bacteroidia bacterium]
MRIVLDTNAMLVAASASSPFCWIFSGILKNNYYLCISTEIAMEYEEVISRHVGNAVADAILIALKEAENVIWIESSFRWNLIKADPDDNKFVDCAIAGNAKFIVSEDRHFQILKTITFPKVEVLTIDEFKKELEAAGKLD